MPRYEQLCRNLANSFIRHTNSYYGRENDDSRNGLWHRHTIAGRILCTNEATGQVEIRKPSKTTNRKDQASPDYATRRKRNLRIPLETSSYVFLRHDAIGNPLQPPYGGPHQFISRAKRTIAIEVSNKNVIVPVDRPKRVNFYCTITLNTITAKIAK